MASFFWGKQELGKDNEIRFSHLVRSMMEELTCRISRPHPWSGCVTGVKNIRSEVSTVSDCVTGEKNIDRKTALLGDCTTWIA